MPSSAKPIAVLQGADSAAIQALLSAFAARWQDAVRIVGVVEEPEGGEDSSLLRNIVDGMTHRLFQELGAGSEGCSLDPSGPVQAGELVRRQMEGGCDLVVLSKFGKLEAENGSGLMAAFIAAVEAGVPVLTSVAPRFDARWASFADPLFVRLPADMAAVEAWWEDVRGEASEPLRVRSAG